MTKIPKFTNEKEEADFWSTHDITDYLDQMREVHNVKFPKPKHKSIVVDIESPELDAIKKIASRRHVPFHTIIQQWIKEKISETKIAVHS